MFSFLLVLAAVGTAGLIIDSIASGDSSSTSEDDTPPDDIEITGSTMDDLLMGTDEDESFFGLDGDDTISGLDGNDTLRGEGGDDQLFGGNGDDLLIDGSINTDGSFRGIGGGQSILRVTLEDGGDLFGEGGNDTILVTDGDGFGGDGEDVLSNWDEALLGDIAEEFVDLGGDGTFEPREIPPHVVEAGNNLHGGDGDDVITVLQGNGFGDEGDDTIFGNGQDAIERLLPDFFPGTSSNFTISGGDGDDHLEGVATNVFGDDGDDVLTGQFSNLYGGEGDDTIHAGSGGADINDERTYDGGAGDDVITGPNATTFVSDFGQANYLGGEGDDTIDARDITSVVMVNGGEGADTMFVETRSLFNDFNDDGTVSELASNVPRVEINDFDSSEDTLIVDFDVFPTVDGQLPDAPIELEIELIDISNADGPATALRIALPDDTDFSTTPNDPDAQEEFILLNGVTPADINLDSIHVRAVSDGQIISQDGFPALEDDPQAPALEVEHVAPQTGVFETFNL
ncbi:calcium-binding protein [Roseovarius sp. 2305UL8-3]|uniref:calcium-binding protein n=1 Tax=Roseovarius conchicola TaxID=3121636 RepID=UPI0035281997